MIPQVSIDDPKFFLNLFLAYSDAKKGRKEDES